MNRSALAFILAAILAISGTAAAQLASPDIAEHETGYSKIQYIDSGKLLYNFHWTSTKFQKDGKTFVRIDAKGDNDLTGAKRIDWTEETLLEIAGPTVRSVYWKKKSTGAEHMTWSLDYDWTAKKADYQYNDEATGKKEAKKIDLKDGAVGGDALQVALRGFPFEKGAGTQFKSQIVTGDGMLIDGSIIFRGEETIVTPAGPVETYRLELKPSGALGLVAPKMLYWFAKAKPHAWIRYEGRDEGLTNPRTRNFLVEFDPKECFAPKPVQEAPK